MAETTLRLTLTDIEGERCIGIHADRTERLEAHGFGLFLCDVDPDEVSAAPGVIEALLEQPERSGLQGMEFWPDNRMAFCAQYIPLKDINVPHGAKAWIAQFRRVD